MRGSEVLVAATLSLCAACSGTTVGQIKKSDPGGGNRDAGSSGGSTSTIADASMGAVQGNGGGVLVVTPRDAGSDAERCVGVTFAGEYIPIDVLLLVERTPATEEMIPGTTTSWWTATTAGIRSFFDHMSGSSAEVGLKIFPVVAADAGTACSPADYATPDVEFGSLSGPAAQVIETELSARPPASGRPTGPALEGALAYLRTRDAVRLPGHSQAIALLTRGEPDMCQPSTLADLEKVGVDGGLSSGLLYTIALGASAQNMARLGFGEPEFFYIPGGDVEQAVRDALIRTQYLRSSTCSLPLPPTSSAPDFDKIVVSIDSIFGGNYEVPRVPSAADCDRNGGKGWYPGTVDAAPSIVFCHTTCSDPGEIHLLLGCAPQSRP